MSDKTLLDITQEILNSMTGDEVNSIFDTAEAEAVARIVVSVFEGLVSNRNWAQHKSLFQLESLSDNTKPTHCVLPDNCKELLFIRHNNMKTGSTRKYFEKVKWKDPDEFLHYCEGRNTDNSNITEVTDIGGTPILIRTDKHPKFYTSFDDKHIVMDSLDTEFSDTIRPSNTQAHGYIMPVATLEDGWKPDLPMEGIKLLVEEAKSVARFQIDTTTDIKAEQEAGRQGRWLSRKQWSVNGGLKYPDYGRKRNKTTEATFRNEN